MRLCTERPRYRAGRRHVIESEELDRGAAAHIGEVGQHPGNVGDDWCRAGPVDHARAGAAPPFNKPLARELAKGAPHGDPRYAIAFRKLILGRKLDAEGERAAENAVAKHHVDLLRLCLAEPIAQASLPPPAPRQRCFTWYSLAYNNRSGAYKRGKDAADPIVGMSEPQTLIDKLWSAHEI